MTWTIDQSAGDGVFANHSGSLTIDFGDIDNTTGDGIHVTNTNLLVNLTQIGLNVGIGDDGIEVVNNDGFDRMATITSNNIFGLGGSSGIANRGIFINSSGTGTLEADVRFNFVVSTNQTILTTTSGPTPGSLILDLQNSTLTTDTPGVLTEEHVGGGLHSTIVRSWSSPNQVIGSVISGTAGGGILFDQVTFDADANPGNGFQQVQFPGTLDIGSVPPLTITRVTGDGLSFINPTGDLSIETLNVANFNGTGLNVDATGTDFSFTTNGGTIDTLGGRGIQSTNINQAAVSNLQVTGGDGFAGVEVILNEAGLMSRITALNNTWIARSGDANGVTISTAGTAELCLHAVGNENVGSGTGFGLELNQSGSSVLGITQASLLEFAADNPLTLSLNPVGTISFDCTIPVVAPWRQPVLVALPPTGPSAAPASSDLVPEGEITPSMPLVIGTLPAGKGVVVVFQAAINDPLPSGVTQVANQGTVSGTNFADVLTDDPATRRA